MEGGAVKHRVRWMLSAVALALSGGAIAQSTPGNLVAAVAPGAAAPDELAQAESSTRKDPQTATLLLMLADRYQMQSRPQDAERLYKRSLAMFEETMGPRHPNVGTAAQKLAHLHYSLGAYDAAEPYYKRAISVFERSLGAEHANVSALVIELAGTYWLQGRLPEAENEYKRAIAMLVKTRGTDDRSLDIARNGLAAVYRAQGRVNEAELASAPMVRNLSSRSGPVVLRQRYR